MVEAKEVLRVAAILECNQPLPVFGRVGGAYPLRTRFVEIQEVDELDAARGGLEGLGNVSRGKLKVLEPLRPLGNRVDVRAS